MLARLKSRQTFLPIVALTTLMGFQNCSQDPKDADGGTTTVSSFESSLPFGFKATPDTLAYMSCEKMVPPGDYNQDQYFTFRMGAYSTGGLTMSDGFRSSTANYSLTERASLFALSDVNAGVNAILSVQQPNNLQVGYNGNDEMIEGRAIDTFLRELDSPNIAGPIGALPAGVNRAYFPGPDDQRFFEATLRFNREGADPQSVMRGYFNANMVLLVAGFTDADIVEHYLRSPVDFPDSLNSPLPRTATPNNTVYGNGYQVNFAEPSALGFTNTGARVLSAVTEKDLVTKTGGGSWTCPANYQFMIVRPEDSAVTCPVSYDTGDIDVIGKLRRVLRTEYWWINTSLRCVVPKMTGDYCYGRTPPNPINYTGTCTPANCPHFVSVCIRN